MKKNVLSAVVFLWSLQGIAQAEVSNVISDRISDQKLSAQKEMDYEGRQQPPKILVKPQSFASSAEMTKEELAKQPDLVVRAMLPALVQNNVEVVELILPLYENIPAQYQEKSAILWAKAILAKNKRHYQNAINLYRTLLAENASLVPARLQLAIVLFENNDIEAAKDQFDKLKAEELPVPLAKVIEHYQTEISHKDQWNFKGSITYLNDPNLNNAPKSGTTMGNWKAPSPESGQGAGFVFDVAKKWSWSKGLFNEFRLNTNGKYYWDNKKYNELTSRASLGVGFQNALQSFAIFPFAEYTWYAGGRGNSQSLKRYTKAGGASLEWQYRLGDQWLSNSFYEYAEQRYPQRLHLNGNYHFISQNLTYLANSRQYWFAGVNYHRLHTRDLDDSYFRRGINIGWGQEWGKGLSTRLSFSYAQKRYKAPMPIFDLTQRNREYGINASLWHRAVHFLGITPRLTYSFQRVKSNHPFYTYDKNRVFVEFTKTF